MVIPYRDRLINLRSALRRLAEQTLYKTQFEVVLGVMEYSAEYVRLCQEFSGRLRIVSVLADEPWNVARARNLAIGQASGQVLVLLDADMVLAPQMLEDAWQRYFADGVRAASGSLGRHGECCYRSRHGHPLAGRPDAITVGGGLGRFGGAGTPA